VNEDRGDLDLERRLRDRLESGPESRQTANTMASVMERTRRERQDRGDVHVIRRLAGAAVAAVLVALAAVAVSSTRLPSTDDVAGGPGSPTPAATAERSPSADPEADVIRILRANGFDCFTSSVTYSVVVDGASIDREIDRLGLVPERWVDRPPDSRIHDVPQLVWYGTLEGLVAAEAATLGPLGQHEAWLLDVSATERHATQYRRTTSAARRSIPASLRRRVATYG
jgi:hypothetical protein